MSNRTFDVAIAGGGPAAMAVAIALPPSLAVAVIARDALPDIRGETLRPGCRALLDRLGVHERFVRDGHARCEGTMAAWGAPSLHLTDYLLHPEGHGWRIDREAFDAMLRTEAVRRGAAVIPGSVRDVARRGSIWRLDTDSGQIHARVVVDATGRPAMVARRLGAVRLASDRLVGLAGAFQTDGALPHAAYPLIEATCDGWAYSTVTAGGELVVVIMTDSDIAHAKALHAPTSWQRWIEGLPRTRERTARTRFRGAVTVASAHSQRLDTAAGDGWLAAGDAAAAFDPLSTAGVLHALRSGIDAASTVRASLGGEAAAFPRYARAIERQFGAYLEIRRRYYAMEQRWPDSSFWRRRARSGVESETNRGTGSVG